MNKEVAEKVPDIYSYIINEEQSFRTERVPLASNWRDWNMYEHVDRSFTLKNSRFYKGAQDFKRPFNNIILPIANVNYRTEGFDVKDVQIYVDNAENYHKSFLARKFHTWWARDNAIDTAIDESVESYFDYGLALLKNVNEARPEVVPLKQIAFCDQTDIMSGPICLKHHYSISELKDMKGKWKAEEIEKAISMSKFSKVTEPVDGEETKTPGKYVEVYELHGMFPESWLGVEKLGEEWQDTGKYSPQIHIITYYVSPMDGKSKVGVTLFKGKEPKPVFKALVRDPIHGRACGRGGIEELFHPQIWTNYSEMHILQMLEATAKVILKTNDKKLKNQNHSNMKQGQIIDLDEGKTLEQLVIQPINKAAFDNFVNKWEQVARTIGSASDPQLGLNPTSGTPLGTTEIVTSQGIGIHEYRQGKIATFWGEVYRDWVLPHLQSEINKGHKWLDELTLSELQDVADKVATKEANRKIIEMMIGKPTGKFETHYDEDGEPYKSPIYSGGSGKMVSPEEVELMKSVIKETFMKGGEKRFLETLKDEFSDAMDVEISIKNKQKNMAEVISKLNSVFRTLFTPGAIEVIQQNKGLSELLNNIFESGGLSPVNFGSITGQIKSPMQTPMQPQQQEALSIT